MEKLKFLLIFLLVNVVWSADEFTSTPVVLWHGMGQFFNVQFLSIFNLFPLFTFKSLLNSLITGDSCCFPFSMGMIKKLIESNLNNTVYVKSLEIGGSLVRDYESSYFIHPQKQVSRSSSFLSLRDFCLFTRNMVKALSWPLRIVAIMWQFGDETQFGLQICRSWTLAIK